MEKNVYTVKLAKPVKLQSAAPHFSKETVWLYVVASSFASALDAVQAKHPDADIRGVDLLNYTGVPIVVGD